MASEGILKRIIRWLTDWIYPILISIILGLILYVLWKLGTSDEILVAIIGIVISTLIALSYSISSPTVSVKIMSGINYYSNRLGIDKSQLSDEYLYDTRFIIKNISKYSTKVYVNLNLKLDGKLVPLGHDYCGKKRWELFPDEGLNGHFQNIEYFREAKINNSEMTMEINISNTGFYQFLVRYPTNKWEFNFSQNKWENKETGTYY